VIVQQSAMEKRVVLRGWGHACVHNDFITIMFRLVCDAALYTDMQTSSEIQERRSFFQPDILDGILFVINCIENCLFKLNQISSTDISSGSFYKNSEVKRQISARVLL